MDVIKKLSLLMVLIICTGCGSTKPIGLDASGLDELKRLCEQDAGLIINKTVEADGYYDASRKGGAIGPLIPSDYRFVEFCDFDSKRPSFDEPGCWRLTKVSRETGQCDGRVDKTLWESGKSTTMKFRENNCIAVEKIEKPTARYSYDEGLKSWLAKNDVSEFIRTYARLEDTESGEILSEYISYSYNKIPRHTSPKSCYFIDEKFPSYKEANIVKSTIKSIQGGMK